MKIRVDGKSYKVIDNLGYQHSRGARAVVVVGGDGKERVALVTSRGCGVWATPRIEPAGQYVGQGGTKDEDAG